MYKFLQILKRDFLNLVLNPMWSFFSIAFPFLLVLILGFLNSGAYGSEVTSYDYYGITIMIYMIFMSSCLSANSFMEERIKKGNMRLIYAPLPKSYIYISKIVAAFSYSAICDLLLILTLKVVLNINFGGNNIIYIILLLIIFQILASILGVLLCIIFKSENTANQVLNIFINVFAILGGLFFRVDSLGSVVEKTSYISPIKWIVSSVFRVIYDRDFTYYIPTISFLIFLCVLGLIMCKRLYKGEDYIC
ncbi:ABC transporter permease [Clostridium gasigenes]|uniref:Transport permease protein n=1 Tax=Clostridium gasigenes TaxID=94869 RepID=A0A1H0M098_9CLOT|nr:ABC transporter permease [Clostridium gasigenes]SDO73620.1 ABC-2 type transport system permease protein [Clostridium gasigenes]